MAMQETHARIATRPIDLVLDRKFGSIEAVMKTIGEALFEGLEFEPKLLTAGANQIQVPALRAVAQR